jgi:hypothetical protein
MAFEDQDNNGVFVLNAQMKNYFDGWSFINNEESNILSIMDIIEIEIAPITRSVLLGQALIWVRQVKLFEYAVIEVRLMDDFDY